MSHPAHPSVGHPAPGGEPLPTAPTVRVEAKALVHHRPSPDDAAHAQRARYGSGHAALLYAVTGPGTTAVPHDEASETQRDTSAEPFMEPSAENIALAAPTGWLRQVQRWALTDGPLGVPGWVSATLVGVVVMFLVGLLILA